MSYPSATATWVGSGFLDVLDPRPEDLPPLAVIARSLGRECRWNGVTLEPYTVAEHSVATAEVALDLARNLDVVTRRAVARKALSHDFPEFVLRDVSSPAKRGLPDYCQAHRAISRAVEERFRVFADFGSDEYRALVRSIVRDADARAAATEKAALLPDAPAWPGIAEPHEAGLYRSADPAAALLFHCRRWGLD